MRIALLLVVLALPASAQELVGALEGTVTDSHGELLIGTIVRLEGTTVGTATDVEGRFVLADVPIGTYTVSAAHIGLQTSARQVVVRDGEVATARFVLMAAEGGVEVFVGCWNIPNLIPRTAFTSRSAVSHVYQSSIDTGEDRCASRAENMVFLTRAM